MDVAEDIVLNFLVVRILDDVRSWQPYCTLISSISLSSLFKFLPIYFQLIINERTITWEICVKMAEIAFKLK